MPFKTVLEKTSLAVNSTATLLKNEFGSIELFNLNNSSDNGNLKGLRFIHKNGHGSVSLYGGQVLTWQPTNQQPVFWLSQASNYDDTHAIRGGVPICWPWFGGDVKLSDGNTVKTSNHGFARQSQWQLDDIDISESAVIITLSLSGENFSSLWPEKFKLSQRLLFSEQFQQALTMTNLSDHTVEYTGALHSYFCISSPQQSNINSLGLVEFDDKLSGEYSQLATLDSCTGPIDRIYHSSHQQRIVDLAWQREIVVSSKNCAQWVMWNPGSAVASSMADMHLHSENEFVCLEAANTKFQAIASQESLSISQKVTISRLS